MAAHSDLTGDELHEPKPHATSHVGGSDTIQMATPEQAGLMSAYQAAVVDEGVSTSAVSFAIEEGASKTTPVDTDLFGYLNSADDFFLVTMTVGELKAFLKAYFDTIYAPLV